VGESSFWYRPTRVVPDQRPLNGRCCCCSLPLHWSPFSKLTSSLSFVQPLVPQKSTVMISGRRRGREEPCPDYSLHYSKGYDNEHYQQQLFGKVVRLLNHVLHALLPPSSTASQRYNLRHRAHSLQLPQHSTQLSDSNFQTRMLYKNTY